MLRFLSDQQKVLLSQIQGRSYANLFGLVERFINAKVLELSSEHWLGDQVALEAMIRFSDEEIKHQQLFRRVEAMIGEKMPVGYQLIPQPDAVAEVVLSKSTWSVLALTLLIELFTQAHYKAAIEDNNDLSPLFKDIFRFHWMEEIQHAKLDEIEWKRINEDMSVQERDQAVNDLIDLVAAVDGILQAQSDSDASYFISIAGTAFSTEQEEQIKQTVLSAYRYQYIFSGVEIKHFQEVLFGMLTEDQSQRVQAALAGIQ